MRREGYITKKKTYVEKELGKDLKNCLWVVSWRDTMRVANRSRVS